MLIAEDLLLLLFDDRSGKDQGGAFSVKALAGAILVELATSGGVDVEPKQGFWHTPKVVTGSGPPLADPLLEAALRTVAEKPRSAQAVLDKLAHGLKDALAQRLVDRGVLRREDDRVLGLFPRTRWPATDTQHEAELRRDLDAVLRGGTPDERSGALLALLDAINVAHTVLEHDGLRSSEVRARAKEVARGDWATGAVRDAVRQATAATAAAVTAATVAASAGGIS